MGELIASLDNYSIYKSYIDDNNSYYLCVPNGKINNCQIVLGFSNDELDTLSKEEIIAKISEVNNMIYSLNDESIYAVPNIPVNEFKDAVMENDDRLYSNIFNNRIQPITMNIYDMLIKNGIKNNNISQLIQVIRRTDNDKKITGWLSMKLGDNYIKEVDYDWLLEKYKMKESVNQIEIGSIIDNVGNIPIVDENIFEDNISKDGINDSVITLEL